MGVMSESVLAVLLSWLCSGNKYSERSLTSIRHLNEHIIQYTGGFKYCIITVSFYFILPIPYFHPPLRGRVRQIDDNFSIPHSHIFRPGIHGSVEEWGIFSPRCLDILSVKLKYDENLLKIFFYRLESFNILNLISIFQTQTNNPTTQNPHTPTWIEDSSPAFVGSSSGTSMRKRMRFKSAWMGFLGSNQEWRSSRWWQLKYFLFSPLPGEMIQLD